ncbi:adenylate kinase [Elusimicrobiota bacterium]
MKIVLLGCPGAGKGTQAKVLCRKYGVSHISTGDVFRAEIEKQSVLGKKVADYVNKGMLVPDETVVEVVASKLDSTGGGWLLDGFPRNLDQAQELDKYLQSNKIQIDIVLYIAMQEEAVIKRLASRWTCASCSEVYNVQSRPPKLEGLCDRCGKKLMQREDDKEATVRKRLMVYEDLTRPLVAYYRSQHHFQEVDGARTPDEVTQSLTGIIDAAAVAGRDA